jgi:hypothetical protein
MEEKVHVPVDRQTCHVIPGTNLTAQLRLGVNSSAINRHEISSLIAFTCKDITKQSHIPDYCFDGVTANRCVSMRENPRRAS